MDKYGKTPSVWSATTVGQGYPSLAGDIAVDVAIIGAGITGLTLATYLKAEGKTVAVIERARIGGGVTGRTTAHITEIVDGRYQTLVKNFGTDGARLIAESSQTAIKLIADMVKRERIACDFQWVSGYLYTEYKDKLSDIEKEVESGQQLGVRCEFTHDVPLPFPTQGGLKINHQAQFHPLQYIDKLAKSLPGSGCYLFENTPVQEYEAGTPCRVVAESGTITAPDVVMATHTPIGLNVALQTRIAPYRSYVIGVYLDGQDVPHSLFWDTEDPYNYIRSYHDLLIVGGRDHKTGQDDNPEARYAELETYVRERFKVADTAYRWSAQVYEPVDNAPYIGLSPGEEHVYVATGYAGNGMTYGTIGARLLADLLLGHTNRWSEVFDPARFKPLASAEEFIKENINVGQHFVMDRLGGSEVDSLVDVPAGQGKIIELEGEKVAAYRSPEGTIHLLLPACKHMGCYVQWNEAEATWDCPCHGGRYTATGEIIEGPPTSNLDIRPISQAHRM